MFLWEIFLAYLKGLLVKSCFQKKCHKHCFFKGDEKWAEQQTIFSWSFLQGASYLFHIPIFKYPLIIGWSRVSLNYCCIVLLVQHFLVKSLIGLPFPFFDEFPVFQTLDVHLPCTSGQYGNKRATMLQVLGVLFSAFSKFNLMNINLTKFNLGAHHQG